MYKLYDKGLTTQEVAQRLNTNNTPYINAHGRAKNGATKKSSAYCAKPSCGTCEMAKSFTRGSIKPS